MKLGSVRVQKAEVVDASLDDRFDVVADALW